MPETTQNFHHIPVANKKKGNKLRTITLGKGIKALYDVKRKLIVTFLFAVDQYTMKQAKQWIKKHKSSAMVSIEATVLSENIKTFYEEFKEEVLQHLEQIK